MRFGTDFGLSKLTSMVASLKVWQTLNQHKAGLAVALLCGVIIGSALAVPTKQKEPSLTPIAALFQSAGWSLPNSTNPIASITTANVAPEPTDDTLITTVMGQNPVVNFAAVDTTNELSATHRQAVIDIDDPALNTGTTSDTFLPATHELINNLRPKYLAQSVAPDFATAIKTGSFSDDYASNWIPADALAAPAVASNSILRSVVSTSVAKVNVTQGRAVILNLNEPVARLTISNSGVAQAKLISPSEIQIIGQSTGVANLILWPSFSGDQQVIDINVHRDLSLLRTQLQSVDRNLDVIPSGDDGSVALTGNVNHSDTAQYAVELASAFFNGNGQRNTKPSSSQSNGSSSASTPAANSGGANKGVNIVNLITVNGKPTSKLSLVRQKLQTIHPDIKLDVVKHSSGQSKAVLTGHVPSADIVSQAINAAAVVYGQPGIKIVTGPGGNQVTSKASDAFQNEDNFSSNLANNVLQGTLITDASGNVVSLMTIAERPQIRCTIKFLEINRNDLNQLGATAIIGGTDASAASFSGSQGNPARTFSTPGGTRTLSTAAGGSLSQVTNTVNEVLGNGATQIFTLGRDAQLALTALVEKRQIRSLAEPTLTMLSGEKGSFLAGGEVPIPVSATNGQIAVEFKDFGIRLNIVPTIIRDDQINLQIAPEVSSVDNTIFVNAGAINIPGFRTRRMQTTLEVMNGEQIVLAGLFNNEDIRAASRFPILGQIPILGSLFRAKNRNSTKTEMIVILRPQIVKRTVADPVIDDPTTAEQRARLTEDLQDAKDEKDENISKHLIQLAPVPGSD